MALLLFVSHHSDIFIIEYLSFLRTFLHNLPDFGAESHVGTYFGTIVQFYLQSIYLIYII